MSMMDLVDDGGKKKGRPKGTGRSRLKIVTEGVSSPTASATLLNGRRLRFPAPHHTPSMASSLAARPAGLFTTTTSDTDGHIVSILVCIYLSGVDAEKTRKLQSQEKV